MDGGQRRRPPVVLLHGGPGLWDYLAPLAALLDGEFTVVRFDQRGCGRSTGHGGPFTIAQAVDDMDQVRAALGFSRWAVAGHSWGAELALRHAARHPDLVTAVAYIAGVGTGNGFRDAHKAELGPRLGPGRERWAARCPPSPGRSAAGVFCRPGCVLSLHQSACKAHKVVRKPGPEGTIKAIDGHDLQ